MYWMEKFVIVVFLIDGPLVLEVITPSCFNVSNRMVSSHLSVDTASEGPGTSF